MKDLKKQSYDNDYSMTTKPVGADNVEMSGGKLSSAVAIPITSFPVI